LELKDRSSWRQFQTSLKAVAASLPVKIEMTEYAAAGFLDDLVNGESIEIAKETLVPPVRSARHFLRHQNLN